MKNYSIALLLTIVVHNSFSQHDYEQALHLSTYFLGAQRCGDTDSWIHPSGGCHMTDGQDVSQDLTGGWHDCGDYIKFHVTGPYTALLYLYGYDKYPEAYADNYSPAFSAPPANGIPDVLDEVKIETDYLIKCVNGSTIYWQVGGQNDHNSFKEPISNSNENLYSGSNIRPVWSATSGHSNAFGNSAAALALMSILYRPYDATYADQCETAAISYYNIGKISADGTADAEAFAYSWLSSADHNDEMGMGAVMLYRATGTVSYLTDAENYASGLSEWVTFNYGTLNHLLFYELYEQTTTSSYLTKIGTRVNNYSNESCGYYHVTTWGSLRDASNAALLALLYHRETGNASAYSFAKSNIDFILGSHGYISGDAPANFSFLIGYNELGGGYPQHPHHSAAFGKSSNDWSLYTQEGNTPGSVPYGYELTGGLAGGPESACSNFTDNINNYISSEYCTYYNAAFNSAVAYIHKVENSVVASVDSNPENTIMIQTIFNNQFSLYNPEGTFQYITISSLDGKVVLTQKLLQGQQVISLPRNPSGVYLARLYSQDTQKTYRLVKN